FGASGAIFVGGDFTTIGGRSRRGLAKLSDTTGAADVVWNPSPSTAAYSLVAAPGDTLYVGGTFRQIGGAGRLLVAALPGAVDAVFRDGFE
ncbi:MAG TPA: hypothetical protein VFO79_03390, partial [Xanthomonadales bacterium]|nr:hypothetical protein [Xanthomonadales bacterium]